MPIGFLGAEARMVKSEKGALFPEQLEYIESGVREARKAELLLAQFYTGHGSELHPLPTCLTKKRQHALPLSDPKRISNISCCSTVLVDQRRAVSTLSTPLRAVNHVSQRVSWRVVAARNAEIPGFLAEKRVALDVFTLLS